MKEVVTHEMILGYLFHMCNIGFNKYVFLIKICFQLLVFIDISILVTYKQGGQLFDTKNAVRIDY